MFTLVKSFSFEASHQLPQHDGKCRRLHGHSWKLKVFVTGELQKSGPQTGMVIDYGQIKQAVKPLLDDRLDHYHLNESTGLANPTSEVLARWIFGILAQRLPGLVAVEVEETCTSGCRYEPFAQPGSELLNTANAVGDLSPIDVQEAVRNVAGAGVFTRDTGANAIAKDGTPAAPKPYPCIESTVEFVAGTYEVRAWINESDVKDEYDNSAFKSTATACAHLPLGEFAKCLAALPRVNAVHVKDLATGDGIVPYVNWP